MLVTAKRTVITLLSVMMLSIITYLIVSIIKPVPLPFISHLMKNGLENRFHTYYIDFDTVKSRLRPIKGVLEFHFSSINALDYGDNILATAPNILAEVKINSFFNDHIWIQGIEFQNPKISFIRTTGGALKFDIGNTHDGASGKILETILMYIATSAINDFPNHESLTEIRINNSDLTLSDDVSGSLLRVPDANIVLTPNKEGVGCVYDFNVLARNENLHISGKCIYKTRNEKLNLIVNLDKIRPALLTEIAPHFTYLTPLEVQLTGKVEIEIDKLLIINKAEFDLVSEKGSLELIDYFGKNLEIFSLQIVGNALNNFSHIELDKAIINLEEAHAEGNALFLNNNENLDIKINALISGTSISTLLPRWFAYLEKENLDCISRSSSNQYKQSLLTIEGVYDLKQHQINALGNVTCLDKKLADNDISRLPINSLLKNSDSMQKFSMDGAFKSPNLTTIQ